MKSIVVWICLFLSSAYLFAQKEVSYKIVKADVFFSGAKLYTESKVNLEAGLNTIVIQNISNYYDSESVQVQIEEGASLLSVNPSVNYLKNTEVGKREKELLEEQKSLTQKYQFARLEKESLVEERALINDLMRMEPKEKSMETSSVKIQALVNYYSSQILELKKKEYKLEVEMKKVQEDLSKVNDQLRLEMGEKRKNLAELVLTIEAKSAGVKAIHLSYMVGSCGWFPDYDLKAEGKEKPLELVLRASIWQQTGVDWDQVTLNLMSNRPLQDQNEPQLLPLFVNSRQALQPVNAKSRAISADMLMEVGEPVSVVETFADDRYLSEAVSTDINVTYPIAGVQSVKGNGTPSVLLIEKKSVEARFVYYAVPKISEQVFLLAYIPKWNELNLLVGQASIYMQGVFIGKVHIQPSFIGDEYPMSFGVDNRINISHKLNREVSSERFVGGEKKKISSFEINIQNRLQKEVEVEVYDQIPISRDKKIKVILDDQGGALYDEEKGSLKWLVQVPPAKSVKKSFQYELRFPKDVILEFSNY